MLDNKTPHDTSCNLQNKCYVSLSVQTKLTPKVENNRKRGVLNNNVSYL